MHVMHKTVNHSKSVIPNGKRNRIRIRIVLFLILTIFGNMSRNHPNMTNKTAIE